MADYYPVLVRAVSRLAINDAQARREVYERAQTIVIAELRRQDPQKSAPEIMRELVALETAIRRVEAESLSNQTQAPEGPTPPHLTATSAAIADDGNDIGVRRESLAGNEAKVRPAPAQPKEIDTSKIERRMRLMIWAECLNCWAQCLFAPPSLWECWRSPP